MDRKPAQSYRNQTNRQTRHLYPTKTIRKKHEFWQLSVRRYGDSSHYLKYKLAKIPVDSFFSTTECLIMTFTQDLESTVTVTTSSLFQEYTPPITPREGLCRFLGPNYYFRSRFRYCHVKQVFILIKLTIANFYNIHSKCTSITQSSGYFWLHY